MTQESEKKVSLATEVYGYLADDEDARVCKDIPDSSCNEQPRAFVLQLTANTLTRLGDNLMSAKLVLPWLLSALGSPAFLISLLVPVRESLSLVPQLLIAQFIRQSEIRKYFWVTGSLAQGICLLLMVLAVSFLPGTVAAFTIIFLLALFSLSRGICSVAAKDVLGKTISKSRRGRLNGTSTMLGGICIIIVAAGFFLLPEDYFANNIPAITTLLLAAGFCWLIAALVYMKVPESPGSTEGGANAFTEAVKSLSLLKRPDFRRFVSTRALLISVSFAVPYLVISFQQINAGDIQMLGGLIIASGIAGLVSGRFWGRWADSAAHLVMASAAYLAAATTLMASVIAIHYSSWLSSPYLPGFIVLLMEVAHQGVRIARKTYLVDLADSEERASYTAVSNTVIGILLMAGGLLGILDQLAGTSVVLWVLVGLMIAGATSSLFLKNVSE